MLLVIFRYGAPYDLAARRKNATRESTGTLKAWLNEHKKNPYPTKGEKIMLAIITKMTLTQVRNARKTRQKSYKRELQKLLNVASFHLRRLYRQLSLTEFYF